MDRRDELEQQIWEFVYDLLPEDEADALRRRIAADSDAARLYDEVRRKAAILAQAARLELPPIPLTPPAASLPSSAHRWTSWAVALAASFLLCYLGFAGFRTRSLERSLAGDTPGMSWAEQPVRTVVFGPSALQPTLTNYFAVQTQTAAGAPRATAVDYRVIGDDGSLVTSGQVQSDASGFAQFNFRTSLPSEDLESPRFQNVHLELEPQMALPAVTVRRTLPLAARELTTYLSADKTIYRPGETLRCRSVTLDRAALQVLREGPVEFLVLNAAGQELRGTRREVLSQHGVAFAELELPRFQPMGKHTLVARSPIDAFPEARREFQVRPYVTPPLPQKPDSARDSDEGGGNVEGELSVEFFPESGELVEGVSNRVYCFAYDARDKPVAIQGRVIDDRGRELTALQTIHDGRGTFVFRPQRGESYRLELDPASGAKGSFELPPISDQQFLVLDAAPGVFAAEAPLKVRLRTNAVRPVAVSAVCRGVVVGQEFVSPTVFQQEREAGGPEILVPVAETAEGVIRLTAYDYSVQPPAPVAERLVFRRPGRKLTIQPNQEIRPYQPGESVQLAFSVQDEHGRPLPAVLGAAVVDEAALSLVPDRAASLTTHFWLTGQIDDVRGLEDANVYLADGSQPEQALDLLLGTQGWRRFVRWPADQTARASLAEQSVQRYFSAADLAAVVPVAEPAAPAVLADNAAEAVEAVRSGLASLHTAYALTVLRVGRVLVLGSLTLAVMLGLLAVMRRMPATTVWLPALGTSALCLVLGGVWLATSGGPQQEYAKVVAAQAVADVQLARVDEPVSHSGATAPAVALESARAEKAASERWYGIENQRGKDGSLAVMPPLGTAAAPADESAGMLADESAPPQVTDKMGKRRDADREAYGVQDRRRQAETDRLLLRQRGLKEQAEAVDELQREMPAALESRGNLPAEAPIANGLPQDMPMPAEPRAVPFGAAQGRGPEASRPRAAATGRAAGGDAGPGEASRLFRGAMPAAPRPEVAAPTPAGVAPAGADAASALAESPGAARAPLADQAAAQPMSAASPLRSGPARPEPHGAAALEAVAESEAEQAKPKQLGHRKKAEQAPAAMPALAGQVTSDAAALLGAPADEMGGLGGGLGTAFGREAAAPDQMFRQYAPRGRREIRGDEDAMTRETVCWEPLLLTDAQGQATIPFRLPDAAAAYRVLVDGHAQGRIGSHRGRIVVQSQPASP